mgnify:CR=1 FL=1
MPGIELSSADCDMLNSILSEYLGDLRMEISDTYDSNFKRELKRKEDFLKRLLNELIIKTEK